MSFTLPDLVVESVLREGLDTLSIITVHDNLEILGGQPTILADNRISIQIAGQDITPDEITLGHSILTASGDVFPIVEVSDSGVGNEFIIILTMEMVGTEVISNLTGNMGNTIDVIDNVSPLARLTSIFGDFSQYGTVIANKYMREAERINLFLNSTDIAIVHSFNEVQTRVPCISIQLKNDIDDRRTAPTADFGGEFGVVDSFLSGDSRNLDEGLVLSDVQISVGIHTKDSLMTRYIYTLVKYILLSRRIDLERRGLIASTFGGSDFMRDMGYQGDIVYTRFLTVIGKAEDTWIDPLEDVVIYPTAAEIAARRREVSRIALYGIFTFNDSIVTANTGGEVLTLIIDNSGDTTTHTLTEGVDFTDLGSLIMALDDLNEIRAIAGPGANEIIIITSDGLISAGDTITTNPITITLDVDNPIRFADLPLVSSLVLLDGDDNITEVNPGFIDVIEPEDS